MKIPLNASAIVLLVLAVHAPVGFSQMISGTIEHRAEGEKSAIGFDTVAAARETLSATYGDRLRTDSDGWLQIEDRQRNVLWSFVPEDHAAYPSVLRRGLAGKGRSLQIDMSALCEAEKDACEVLMRRMVRMNEIARRRLVDNLPRGAGARPDETPIGGLIGGGRGP